MKVKLAVLVLVGALATGASALAVGNGVIASANGDYAFSGPQLGTVLEVGPFTWNVQVKADGSVKGSFDYVQVRDGGAPLSVSGRLTCAFFDGDRVWVGGVIEASSRADLVGLDTWFQARDNGEGANAPRDISTPIGAGVAPAAQVYCDDHPPATFPFDLAEGNLQVRSS